MNQFDIKRIEKLISEIKKNNEWGTYYPGKYYFTIVAHKSKEELGIETESKEISKEIQLKLQQENYVALFHEYIHYLHEVSTIIGSVGLSLDLSLKSIFSYSLNPNKYSSTSLGVNTNPQLFDKFSKFLVSQDVIMGGMADDIKYKILNVIGIRYKNENIYVAHGDGVISREIEIPIIEYDYLSNGKIFNHNVHFGKFFIYEGIAYELDRIVDKTVYNHDKINDESEGTEYTVLRKLAVFIFPEVETITYLSVASLSLQYINCGKQFINMLIRVKNGCRLGTTQAEILVAIKTEVSELLNKAKSDYLIVLDEFKNIFLKRKRLTKAFTYLTDRMKEIYEIRIKHPTIEVDYVYNGNFRGLLDDVIQICDYMYIFDSKDEFMRDVLGTSIDLDTSDALKVMLSYDDFYQAHFYYKTEEIENEDYKCPFYTCCNLMLRKEHAEICASKPWRIFEVSSSKGNQYCWYGQGVLEFKGVNER